MEQALLGLEDVRERAVLQEPLFALVRLERQGGCRGPPLVIVAPLSGHRPALMRDAAAALLADHDVHLLAWPDAGALPAAAGRFGLDENIAAIMECVRLLGPETHLFGVSQAPLPILAAAALLAQAGEPGPRSIILVSGFLDPRINPTRVGRLVRSLPRQFFERVVTVDAPALGRRLYPREAQRTAMLLYLARHLALGGELARKLRADDGLDAERWPFLGLYLSLVDLPAELLLDVVRCVFHETLLPRARLRWRGQPVEPAALTRTALLTIEGGRDDVSGRDQTAIAHLLCRNVAADRRGHHTETGAGHFGTFHGALWRRRVAPLVAGFVHSVG